MEAWSPIAQKRADSTVMAMETRYAEESGPPPKETDASVQKRVVTTATVEAWPTWFSDVRLALPVAASPTNSTASIHMEFETLREPAAQDSFERQQHVVEDTMQKRPLPPSSGLCISEKDAVGGNQDRERFFPTREPAKRVTFDLFATSDGSPLRKGPSWTCHQDQCGGESFFVMDKRSRAVEDEDSEDSMYNSGESFPPPPPTCFLKERFQRPEEGLCGEDESASKLFDAYGFNPSCCHMGSPPPPTPPHLTVTVSDSSDSDEEDEMSSDSGGGATLFNASKLVVTSSPARTKCLTIPQTTRHGARPPPMESSL